MIKEVKNNVPWTYVINDLNGEEIIGTFYEKGTTKKKKKKIIKDLKQKNWLKKRKQTICQMGRIW